MIPEGLSRFTLCFCFDHKVCVWQEGDEKQNVDVQRAITWVSRCRPSLGSPYWGVWLLLCFEGKWKMLEWVVYLVDWSTWYEVSCYLKCQVAVWNLCFHCNSEAVEVYSCLPGKTWGYYECMAAFQAMLCLKFLDDRSLQSRLWVGQPWQVVRRLRSQLHQGELWEAWRSSVKLRIAWGHRCLLDLWFPLLLGWAGGGGRQWEKKKNPWGNRGSKIRN